MLCGRLASGHLTRTVRIRSSAINHRSPKLSWRIARAKAVFYSAEVHVRGHLMGWPGGRSISRELDMSEKLISRRGAFSLLGISAALGFAVPTTMLMESDAEAQMQPTAPAPSAPAPTTQSMQPMPGMQQGEQPTGGKKRRQARHNARTGRRQARHNARTGRREARGKSDKIYMKGNSTKQQ